jgi:hypothetical protein
MRFIINTLTHWEEPPRARHQVAQTLSKNHQVVFVTANKIGLLKIRSVTVHENLTLLSPFFPIGHKFRYRLPFINELYQNWLFRKLHREYKDYIVINFDFTATKIFNYFDEVIYYCNDNFSSISKYINPLFVAKYHKLCESKVAAKAKFCIAVSKMLKDHLLQFNPNTFEIPLGSPSLDQYSIVTSNKPVNNEVIEVGLLGFISLYNISYKTINLILMDDKIQLTMIGPVAKKFLALIDKKDKLILRGVLRGKELYDEINKFDVTIAPYCERLTKDEHSGVGTGSKIYHYLALGKPVVISFMAGLNNFDIPSGFLYIAKSDEEFPVLIKKACKENSEELIKQRINYARNNTWEKRMQDLEGYIKKFEEN